MDVHQVIVVLIVRRGGKEKIGPWMRTYACTFGDRVL
jgi:hypothetical protein